MKLVEGSRWVAESLKTKLASWAERPASDIGTIFFWLGLTSSMSISLLRWKSACSRCNRTPVITEPGGAPVTDTVEGYLLAFPVLRGKPGVSLGGAIELVIFPL